MAGSHDSALAIVAAHHGLDAGVIAGATTLAGTLDAAVAIGLSGRVARGTVDTLGEVALPAILHVVRDGASHYVAALAVRGRRVAIADSARGISWIDRTELEQRWSGAMLLLWRGAPRAPKRRVMRAAITAATCAMACVALAVVAAAFTSRVVGALVAEHASMAVVATATTLALVATALGLAALRALAGARLRRSIAAALRRDATLRVARDQPRVHELARIGGVMSALPETTRAVAAIADAMLVAIVDGGIVANALAATVFAAHSIVAVVLAASAIPSALRLVRARRTLRDADARPIELDAALDAALAAHELHKPALAAIREGIELRGASCRGRLRARVLEQIDLAIPAGATVAILAAGTTGKRIVELLQRLRDPSEGRVAIDGIDARDLDPASVRARIVLVPRRAELFTGSVRDNIAVQRPDAPFDHVRDAALDAGLATTIASMPQRFATMLDRDELPAAVRQRIALARAFLAKPDVVVLEHATAELDAEDERALLASAKARLAGRTIVIVTDRIAATATADLVYTIDGGRVVTPAAAEDRGDIGPAAVRWLASRADDAAATLQWVAQRGLRGRLIP